MPAWIGTYGDVVTLCMCFFVLLFALSSIDVSKFNAFARSFGTGAKVGSILDQNGDDVISDMLGNGIIQFPVPPNNLVAEDAEFDENASQIVEGAANVDDEGYYELMRIGQSREELTNMDDDLRTYFAERAAQVALENGLTTAPGEFPTGGVDVEVKINDYFISINMPGGATFESGSHNLTEAAIETLSVVSDWLRDYPDNLIEIEGHTDDRPIHTDMYEDNYDLSWKRAKEVMRFFIASGANESNLKPIGYGELHPVDDNETVEGRAKNRRVEIKIFSRVYTGNVAE